MNPGGVHAVKVDSGAPVWVAPPPPQLCAGARGCSAAQGAAVTVVPGIVFAGSMDGGVRAYASDTGAIVWTFDTNRSFDTVNGVAATGGGIEGPGAIVAGGMVFFNSGYGGVLNRPGNVLLAFGMD